MVFGPRSGFVHEMLGHPLEARHADGIFAGKVGQPVTPPDITLMADATLPGLGGSYAFDDEGTPAQRTVLVENGVLRGFMCDRLGAARLGVASTGNGRRASFRHPLMARMSNTILAAGETSQQAMLAGIDRGILVETTLGNRSNAYGDPARFNVVESYLVEKGRVTAPLQSFVLMGKPLDVLPQVRLIADDCEPATGICVLPESGLVPYGDSQPSIRVEGGLRITDLLDLNQMLPALLEG
jgi:TldD protein